MDQVFLKQKIKGEQAFEEHPNLIFGLILAAFSALLFASIFLLPRFPLVVLFLIWAAAIALLVRWIVWKNEQTNLTKSSAFIRRDGVLYYIRLGYSLDGDIPVSALNMILVGPMDAITAARAMENRCKSDAVRELRKQPETFSNYLTAVLNAQKYGTPVPEFIAEYLPMLHAKPEKETPDAIWISYEPQGEPETRKTRKFRNVYDISW